LFKDSALIGNIEYFLSIFKEDPSLTSITSEKGKVIKSSNTFDNNCIFGYVENNLVKDANYLICDDLGNEWADYISIKDNENITFFHCKSGNEGLSASNFHDLVSQAQKNLGNIFASNIELDRKKSKWVKKYSSTNIDRLRKGDNIDNALEIYKRTQKSPNSRKVVHLVVNFISKTKLRNALYELKNKGSATNEMPQILWLISSLILSYKESNTDIYISCLP